MILPSKEGLLRDGPQWFGYLKPSWMSINRSAVLGCCVEEGIVNTWDDVY